MNKCPNCQNNNFTFKALRKAYFDKPAKCKDCGIELSRYHFSEPLLSSIASTLGACGLYVLLFWGTYTFLFLASGITIGFYILSYIEANKITLNKSSEISESKQALISFSMYIVGFAFSMVVFFEAIERL